MEGRFLFWWNLCAVVFGSVEQLKQRIYTVDDTGEWRGKADAHIPMLDMDVVRGGGWNARMWTTHQKTDSHYIGKHWVEDGDGHLIHEKDFSPTDDNILNQEKNQTSLFMVPKGTKEPLTTYAWCTVHGTWAHTWEGVQLSHFEEDVKFDEHGNEIEEPEDEGAPLKKPHEVPVHDKVSAEDLKHLKEEVFTVEAPGRWRGKSGLHVPNMDLHAVEGGGHIAELLTEHGKDDTHFITKHWIEDGAGAILGVVNFDESAQDPNVIANELKRQVSQIHVPKGAKVPLTTYANCNVHGTWAHTWSGVDLDGFSGSDEL